MQQAFDFRSNGCQIHGYVHTLTHIQHFPSSPALCEQPRGTHTLTEAMKDRQKRRVAGPTTGSCTNKATCIEENQRVKKRNCQVYSGKTTRYIYTSIHPHKSMHVCMYDCMRSESESASHSSPPQHKGVRVISACVPRSCMLIKVDKQKTDTVIHISEA